MIDDPVQSRQSSPGVRLADLTWVEAEQLLRPEAIIVIPIGAASKEHGPHLTLSTDWIQAEYLASELARRCEVVIAPTVGYHFYPAFTEYPGSITLRRETARDLMIDICKSLSACGPRRFYALNTGVSTLGPLTESAAALAADGIILRFTDVGQIEAQLRANLSTQSRGTHADEVETSRMLYIAPQTVQMSLATKDDNPDAGPGLTRDRAKFGTYSPTGSWGDPTRATPEKGKRFVELLIEGIIDEIETLRRIHPT